MKITFQGQAPQPQAPEAAPTIKHSAAKGPERTREQGGIRTDISGIVKDNEIFAGHGRTAREIAEQAGQKDVSLTRDYLTVMSNILSENDMQSLINGDMHPGSMPVEQTVTVVDRIKATLMEAGVHIAGYTDTLDDETLNAITGSQALSDQIRDSFDNAGIPLSEDTARQAVEAWDKARTLTPLSDDSLKYMVENNMSPTIEDIYSASHSGHMDAARQGRGYYMEAGGYMSRKADTVDFDALAASIDEVIERAGLAGDERAADAARWLISKGVPLTPESVTDYLRLKDTQLPPTPDTAFDAMAGAVSDGRTPAQADLSDKRSLWEKAVDLFRSVFGLTGADVDEAVADSRQGSGETAVSAASRTDDTAAPAYNDYDNKGRDKADAQTGDSFDIVSGLSLSRLIKAHNKRVTRSRSGTDRRHSLYPAVSRSVDIDRYDDNKGEKPGNGIDGRSAKRGDKPIIGSEGNTVLSVEKAGIDIAAAISGRAHSDRQAQPLGEGTTPQGIRARRLLEEIRLVMTVEANRELIKSGFAIDTAPIEDTIEALKSAQRQIDRRIFGDHEFMWEEEGQQAAEDGAGLDRVYGISGNEAAAYVSPSEIFSRTLDIAGSLPAMPVSLLGQVNTAQDTLPRVHERGRNLQQAYQRAGEQYEALGTQVRRDLGDSIRQAFRNVDDILADMELPVDEANRRALRILGYNRMEVSEANITAVREADQSIRMLMDRMTPGAVMRLIREGFNPLSMTVQELNEQLMGDRDRDESRDRYARFLYRLEKSKDVTPEERESYIGIYRLIRQIEKSDGAVIGNLVNSGAELNFKNLLSALRSRRSVGMDFTVDDNTGLSGGLNRSAKTIEEQIYSAYDAAVERELYERITNAEAAQISPIIENPDIGIESFLWNMPQEPLEETEDTGYTAHTMDRARSLDSVNDDDIGLLKVFDMPSTTENLLAAAALRIEGGADLRRLRRLSHDEDFAGLRARAEDLEAELDSRDSAAEAYGRLMSRAGEIAEASIYGSDNMTGAGVEELGLIYKQLSIVAGLSAREQYDIPVVTEDDVFTLHLKLMGAEDDSDRGRIEASIDAGELGILGFRLRILDKGVSGIFTADSPLGQESIGTMAASLEEALESMGYSFPDIYTGLRSVGSGSEFMDRYYSPAEGGILQPAASQGKGPAGEEVSGGGRQTRRTPGTPELYRIAKNLVRIIRTQIQSV